MGAALIVHEQENEQRMKTVIKCEDVSKLYRLGQVSTGSLAHDVNRWWHTFRGKENPYLKIGETNDRTASGNSEYVWALKDIHFDVKQGEVLGIIGRNGAGKSTLLKILSRTTAPTTGNVRIKGRVASLLEVGTGFHPELSGRDNIFLNGAILGMTKREIKSKFDEIVDFAGVERYIDTPVKRYSSGMYVRLAFAVAAHLESEILIVDEVLAVGDMEFQKKCLGKMSDVSSKDGRTVLFVSHNIDSIRRLCNTGLLISKGQMQLMDSINNVIDEYKKHLPNIISDDLTKGFNRPFKHNYSMQVEIVDVEMINNDNLVTTRGAIELKITLHSKIKLSGGRVSVSFLNSLGEPVGVLFGPSEINLEDGETGVYLITISAHNLAMGVYYINLGIGFGNALSSIQDFDFVKDAVVFTIENFDEHNSYYHWGNDWGSIHFQENEFSIKKIHAVETE